MKKNLFFISISILLLANAKAQQVYKSGGTQGSTFLFSQPSYAAKSQCIFLPAELTNATSGNITTLYYKYGNGTTGQTLYNYTIKIGQTTSTAFATGNVFFTGLDTVLSEQAYSIPQGTIGNWFPITLTTPFTYDATKTLIIQFTFDSVLVNSWLTRGTSNSPVRKIISSDVNAVTGDGSSSVWQDMGFDLTPLSVSSLNESQLEFSFFPNPSKGILNVCVPENKNNSAASFSLLNALGEEVMQLNVPCGESALVDLSRRPKGVYFLKETSAKNARVEKIILE